MILAEVTRLGSDKAKRSWWRQAETSKTKLLTTEVSLGKRDPGINTRTQVTSFDFRRIAYVAQHGHKYLVLAGRSAFRQRPRPFSDPSDDSYPEPRSPVIKRCSLSLGSKSAPI